MSFEEFRLARNSIGENNDTRHFDPTKKPRSGEGGFDFVLPCPLPPPALPGSGLVGHPHSVQHKRISQLGFSKPPRRLNNLFLMIGSILRAAKKFKLQCGAIAKSELRIGVDASAGDSQPGPAEALTITHIFGSKKGENWGKSQQDLTTRA